MTETKNYTTNHNNYSGVIDIEDFSTYEPNRQRIYKYQDADNLEEKMKSKDKVKKKMNTYKSMTLEELKELRLVSNTNGRPSSTLTDKKWQQEFEIRKLFVNPTSEKKMVGKFSRESGVWNEETNGTYDGITNWQSYCCYINDILKNIRAGQTDYCYFLYQILDLLKFHHDDLKTKYRDGYWEVWLDQ